MASTSPITATAPYKTWDALPIIEEGHDKKRELRNKSPRPIKRPGSDSQGRLRTDHHLRRNISIYACVGSLVVLALLGFTIGLMAA
jgi:hypothetical protein